MSKKHEAKSSKRVVASLLAAGMVLTMLPLGALTASAKPGVDDVLSADRPTAYNWLTPYVDLDSVSAKTAANTKEAGLKGNEDPWMIFDGKTSTKMGIMKEHNGTEKPHDHVEIAWAMTEQVTLEHYTLGSGNDSFGRDPKAWTLSASNDEGEEKVYTPISTVENANLNWWDNSLYSSYYPDDYAIENPAPYKYYKIEFTDYRGYEQYFQFSEFVMSGTAASQNNNPIRYEMENLIDDGKVAKSDEAIVLNSGSTDASPSGGKYAQIALKADGNYVTCSLDNIPTSGLYRVSMAVKGNEQSATVALGKDYAKDPANIGPRFVPSAPAFQLNTFGADVPKVTGEFWLHAGTDTIDIVGLANCGANIRPDYIELQKISDYSVRTDLSVANAAGKVTADDGITLATSTDNSSPWGGNINMFWVKKGAADKSVTASVDVPAPGTYQMYVTYKSRETSNQMKVSVNETEVGTIDCYAAGNGSDKVSRSRKYFEPLVGTFTADAAGPANVVFTFASDEHQDANDGAVFVPSEIILVPLDTEPVTPPALDATLPDSAVVHYTFDDGAKDASDNANDGVVTNVDIAGGIATFAGDKNSNIKIESPVMKHANVTVSTMIKVDEQPATWATLWEAYSNNGNQLVRFAINNDNGKDVVSQFRTVKEDGSGTASKLSSGNTKMPVGEWTELTVVAEGVTAILYINGEEVARVSKPNTPMLFSDLQDEGVTYLGHEAKWGDATFKGQMSDFRVYDTALNAVQVAALYAENLKEVTPDPYAELSKEAAAVARQIDALPETTTHRQGPAYRDIKAAFDALTADQKVELGDERAAKLTQVGADLDALYEAFNVTIKKAYPGGNMDKTPWMKGDGLTEEQKEAVYQSVEDEIRYQYVERGFLLRDTDSECELGDWNNRVNLTLENGEDSDNVGRPADWAGQKWSCVNAPFVGVAFSQNGIFGVKAIDEPAISDAFEYNGRIYLVTTSKTASYKAGLDLSGKTEFLPKDIDDNDDFYGYERLENYPGKGRIDWGDITKNTFSYAFALYNQEHKRENKVVGIPVAGEYVKEIEGMKYQRFEGPQGIAYIAASNEAINAAETQNGVKEGAYVIIGEMARALESLGENAEAWFAKTGAPVAKAVTAAGATTQKFANGTLKAQNGKYSFVSDVDLQAIAAVEAKITAAADIASIDTLTDLEAKIAEAKEAYGALDASLQAAVSNLSKLDELDQAVENVKAAERLFTDMTAADAVTEENVADVRAELTQARAAKDALKAYAKFISAAADEKYAAVYQAVSAFVPADEDIASAEELIDAIGVIPDDNTTYKSAPAVYAAKAAYDALSADQQALVNATKKAALEEAVTKMEELAESVKETIYGNVSDDTNRWDNSMDPGVWMNANKHTTDEQKQAVLNAMRDEGLFQYAHEGYDMGLIGGGNTVQPQEGLLYIELGGGDHTPGCNPWSQDGRTWGAIVAPYDGIAFSIKSPFGYMGTRQHLLLGNTFSYKGNVYQLTWNGVHYYAEGQTGKSDVKTEENYPGLGDTAEDITNNTFRYAAARYNQEVKWDGKTVGIPVGAAVAGEGVVYQQFEGPNGEAYIIGDANAIAAASKEEPTKAAYVVTGEYLEAIKAVNADMAAALATTGAPDGEIAEDGRWNFTKGYIKDGMFTAFSNIEIVEQLIAKVSAEEIAEKTVYDSVKSAYDIAKAAYDELSEAEQGEVSNAANLEAALAALSKFEEREAAAKAMKDVLKDLPYAVKDIDEAAREAIAQARVDYDALDEITQNLVTAEYASYLTEAENTVAAADVVVLYEKAPKDYETAWAELDPDTYEDSEEYTTIVKPLDDAYKALNAEAVTKLREIDKGVTLQAIEDLIIWRPGPVDDVVLGDLNKDGNVTIQDVMEACKVLARQSAGKAPTADEMNRGDMNKDGQFTITDVMEICKVLARQSAAQ